jgi:SAM-dependent methyltransferase
MTFIDSTDGARRGRYEGLIQVLRFNRTHYLAAFAAGTAWVLLAPLLPGSHPVTRLGWGAVILAGFWTVASLAVSHWVYDRSEIRRWDWLRTVLPVAPGRWANLHAGFDESTAALRTLFRNSTGLVWDFYDPQVVTEASIKQARRLGGSPPETIGVRYSSLPAGRATLDCAFLIFAAHELRLPEARERLFAELFRTLKPDGRLVMMEHVRDLPNFIAFGPGALHFLSRSEWMRVARRAGFELESEITRTPFVRVFTFRRPA